MTAKLKHKKTKDRRHNKRRKGRRRSVLASNLTRMIFLSNFIGLVILVFGSLALHRFEDSLIDARLETLRSQASTISSVMGETATGGGLSSKLDVSTAKNILGNLELPAQSRVRLYDKSGSLIADSAVEASDISVSDLGPILSAPAAESAYGAEGENLGLSKSKKITLPPKEAWPEKAANSIQNNLSQLPWRVKERDNLRRDHKSEVRQALSGDIMAGQRYEKDDALIVTVSQPVRRVQQVVGVITLESTDVESIVQAEREALAPIIGIAILVTLLSSLALTLFIALPIRRLARAAELIEQSVSKPDPIPDLSRRRDEIGDLSVVMSDMTEALYQRMEDVANFAADVAHEIKNPLTSLRSASDTLRGARTEEQRTKLLDIIENDVGRMDRLISDISKASKVDANLAKDTAETVDVRTVLENLAEFYSAGRVGDGADVVFKANDISRPLPIRAFESAFAQVLRNLIDNALTFSPKKGRVTLTAMAEKDTDKKTETVVITVEDEGPGIPPENLETIFDRFYTERPKGAEFGSHSGLGLAICRQIMTAHKGTIRAENHFDGDTVKGARFILRLPLQS